jgi:MoCo/4Fe-4S cofactor protein with predicted Tat translocation signal
MSVTKTELLQRRHWRSLAELAGGSEAPEWDSHEFPPGATELEMDGMSRRKFLGVMGASMSLAGLAGTGCIRKPVEYIVPYAERPEFIVPGVPVYYRTAGVVGGSVLGLHVESQEGRPTKIEGNPDHPTSNPKGVLRLGGETPYGATSPWGQASVLDLYDPDRPQVPVRGGEAVTWPDFWAWFDERFAHTRTGQGMAVLVERPQSPTLRRVLRDLQRTRPGVGIYVYDALDDRPAAEGGRLVGAAQRRVVVDLEAADVVVSLDADLFGTEGEAVRHQALFASRRRLSSSADEMNRLYAVGPHLTVTAGMADNRLRVSSARVGMFARALAARLLTEEATLPYAFRTRVAGAVQADGFGAWVDEVAADLMAHRGRAVVVAGRRQPAWVHGLAHLMNDALGGIGATVSYLEDPSPAFEGLEGLAEAIRGGGLSTLLIVGGDPVFTAPAEMDFARLLGEVEVSLLWSDRVTETAAHVTWVVPGSHYLESWGDLEASDGTVSLQQPLIAPLYGSLSALDFLARTMVAADFQVYPAEVRATPRDEDMGYALVRDTWSRVATGDFEAQWRRWLHDGVVGGVPEAVSSRPNFNWDELLAALDGVAVELPTERRLELNFYPDNSVYDGRYANNGWLQEMPDPMTKLTWDNAALLSPSTASRLGIRHGELIEVQYDGRTLTMAAMPAPGTADDCVVVTLGYGRTTGGVASGVGFATYRLRTSLTPWFGTGASVSRGRGTYELATTQHHHRMEPRPGHPPRALVLESTLEGWRAHPDFVDYEHLPAHERRYQIFEPHPRVGQQWGMSIDLATCTGCSACVIACQAENNIPIVTKERVLQGRELHWLRIDRYYTGEDGDGIEAVVQPIPCMQCENAPCEAVCPVAATAHSPEGLNDMAYNRCIGTRYCSNNCPYKVRRFNYFNFTRENHERFPMHDMQRNPDVTMRFRGVMEKCTYCVQRIERAKIENHTQGRATVPDGQIAMACSQACPTRSIVFGDVDDETTLVAELKRQSRDYELLGELNNRPRTTFLAKIRNPNPALV